MMADRNDGPDTSLPYRPRYLCPARNGVIADWDDPRGIPMRWRGKWNNGSTSTSYPAWSAGGGAIDTGRIGAIGGGVTNGNTMTMHWDITGRVPPHTWVFTVQKITGGVATETIHTLDITGPGEYSFSFTAPGSGSAQIMGGGNKSQYNLFDDT
jgi:hypothetical protein